MIISQSQQREENTKKLFGVKLFSKEKSLASLKKLDIFNILRNSGKDKREKKMLKHAKKKYNEKWWRIDKKRETPLILWYLEFPSSSQKSRIVGVPCNFHPSFGTHKNQRIRAKSQKLSRWATRSKRTHKKPTDSSITVTLGFSILWLLLRRKIISNNFSILVHQKGKSYF